MKHSAAMNHMLDPTKWAYRPRALAWEYKWVRGCPSKCSGTGAKAPMPHLARSGMPGTLDAGSRPDGMYMRLTDDHLTADVLVIEHCSSRSNLHDKRSRFQASTGSQLLVIPKKWLHEDQVLQRGWTKPRWETFPKGVFDLSPDRDLYIPVTHLRVFMFVPDGEVDSWSRTVGREAHEYLLPHLAFVRGANHKRFKQLLQHAFSTRIW